MRRRMDPYGSPMYGRDSYYDGGYGSSGGYGSVTPYGNDSYGYGGYGGDGRYGRYGSRYNQQYGSPMDERMYYEDRVFDEASEFDQRPTYRRSKTLANPDFGNFHFKKGYTAEVWLNDGETVILSGHTRKKTYRTHYSPELFRTFFFGWLGKLLRYFYLDRLFGLHIDTVKTVKTKNYIFVTAHVLPTT